MLACSGGSEKNGTMQADHFLDSLLDRRVLMEIQCPKGACLRSKSSDVTFPAFRIKTTWGYFVSWPFLVNLDLRNWLYCKLDWLEEHTIRYQCSKLDVRKWHGHQFTLLCQKLNELKSRLLEKLSRNRDRKRLSQIKIMDQCDVSNANGVRREEGQGEGGGGRAEGGCQLEIDVSTTLSLPLFALGLLPPPAARSTPSLTPPPPNSFLCILGTCSAMSRVWVVASPRPGGRLRERADEEGAVLA